MAMQLAAVGSSQMECFFRAWLVSPFFCFILFLYLFIFFRAATETQTDKARGRSGRVEILSHCRHYVLTRLRIGLNEKYLNTCQCGDRLVSLSVSVAR